MDELLALFDDAEEFTKEDCFSKSEQSTHRRIPQIQQPQPRPISKPNRTNDIQHVSVGIDDRIGIRMLNRKISSLDLMNIIINIEYTADGTDKCY
jgi:hypothetical protein